MTLSDQLARHARTAGDRPAFPQDDTTRDYRTMEERVSRLANALRERGVGTGDRVLVLSHNRLEVFETFIATTRLGAIGVPVNFRLVADEIAYLLGDCTPRAAVVQAELAPRLAEAAARTSAQAAAGSPVLTARLVFGGDASAAWPGAEAYEEALSAASPEWDEAAEEVDENLENTAAFIMYTSGTTGRPKGAVLTHRNLLMHTFSGIAHNGTAPGERVMLVVAPLFHIAGLSGFLPVVLLGGHVVLLPSGGFDPEGTVRLLARHGVTTCFMVPAQWQAICDLPDIRERSRRELSALTRISWGAAPASTTLLRRLIATFPQAEVSTAFGQTECSPVTTTLRGEDAIRKIGSVGTPVLNVECRVVDEDMNDVEPGQVGEIVYRGPMVMKEYWNKPEATAEAFRGGWFHSGDLVRQDEDGYYYVVDRKKDMIISGGENIYCAEVENVLAAHPAVAEVAVIGMPDEKWGETPLAVVVPRDPGRPPTAAELSAWCAERMAGYKRPRNLTLLDALPRNPSGKVLKTELRARYAALAEAGGR
jgi:fatty-acyl-CoA synthase/long-chain acyl-CoA synthetase